MPDSPYRLVTILGPTATGKTALAARFAHQMGGEVISADSRQLYRGMTIGTGKDLADYCVDGAQVPYHLIDCCDAGYKYNLFEYQRDFIRVYNAIVARRRLPVLCGGTGLYLEAVLRGYRLDEVPPDVALRDRLAHCTLEALKQRLADYKTLHNTTDVDTVKRAIRAIEIAEYYRTHPSAQEEFPALHPLVIGLSIDRDERRARITRRLKQRLDEGMIDEARALMAAGLSAEDMIYYGLEYKYLALLLQGKLRYEEFFARLEQAIHQFAKRQMTWFRGMERRGCAIRWIDALLPMDEKIALMTQYSNDCR